METADEDELALLREYNLLTYKPVIYAANVTEDDLGDDGASNAMVAQVRGLAEEEHSEVFVICAQIEQEIAELDEEEKAMFLEDLGLTRSGLEKLIQASYSLLGLMIRRLHCLSGLSALQMVLELLQQRQFFCVGFLHSGGLQMRG